MLRFAVLRGAPIALALTAGSVGALSLSTPASAAEADDPDPAQTAEDDQDSINWGPILGACMGVAFGGMLALWQIKGMKNRD